MNLNILSSPVYLGILYILVFPMGYLLFEYLGFKKFNLLPFSVRFPLYLAFGLLSSTLLFYVIGLVFVDVLVPIVSF
jgi:hypothetical protein